MTETLLLGPVARVAELAVAGALVEVSAVAAVTR